jgi:hypothetical protein
MARVVRNGAPLALRFVLVLARQALKVRVRSQTDGRPDPIVVFGGVALAVGCFLPQGLVALWAASGKGPGGRIPLFDVAWYSR